MSQSAVRIFLAVLIGLNLLDHSQYIAEAYGVERGGAWKATAADSGEVLGWLRQHAEPDAIIAADNPAYVYLWTGRRTVAIHSFDDPWSRWGRLGVRYLISLSDVALPTDPARYALRFKLPDKNVWVVELIAGQSVASATQRPERVVR